MDIHLLILTTRRQLVSLVTIVEPSLTGTNVSREFISQDRQMSRATISEVEGYTPAAVAARPGINKSTRLTFFVFYRHPRWFFSFY